MFASLPGTRTTGESSATDVLLHKAEAQSILFAPRLNWADLLAIALPPAESMFRIAVLRNHAFEPLADIIRQYARFGSWEPLFVLSDYDDSFTSETPGSPDLVLLWLEDTRYRLGTEKFAAWLAERCESMARQSGVPVVAAAWIEDSDRREHVGRRLEASAGVHFADVYAALEPHGEQDRDGRLLSLGGTPLGREAQALVARELSRWISACLLPPVKAVALDLDGTMHAGVLGEEGVAGVQVTEGHLLLHKQMQALRERGIYLCLCTRNNEDDVRDLLCSAGNSTLQWDDYAVAKVNWQSKELSIMQAAEQLRIGTDSILMVDDNPGELASAAAVLPQTKFVWAAPDATVTSRSIEYFPGLWRWAKTAEDALRLNDAKANAIRGEALAEAEDADGFFKALQVSLAYDTRPTDKVARLASLSTKTNQFNLALARLAEGALAASIADPDAGVVAVALSDRLSDSGVIGLVVAKLSGSELHIKDACISCRALGRRLEHAIVLGAIQRMDCFRQCTSVIFSFEHGPRNEPALKWLAELMDAPLPKANRARVDASKICSHRVCTAIRIVDRVGNA